MGRMRQQRGRLTTDVSATRRERATTDARFYTLAGASAAPFFHFRS